MLEKAKNVFLNICPEPLLMPAANIVRRGREICYRTDAVLYPHKTIYSCPCCGLRFRSFIEGDYRERPKRFNHSRYESARQDVLCPHCKSLPRHRILALWCEKHIDILRGADILYFAPDRCESLWMEKYGMSFKSADLHRAADYKLNIQDTHLPGGSYDIIICNHVLEHVDDFRKALKEMYRVLRPSGSFICSFPMDPSVELVDEDPTVKTEEERLRRFGQNDHLRVFGMHPEQFLTDAGFVVERIIGEDCPEEILPVIGPADYDMNILFWCRKESK